MKKNFCVLFAVFVSLIMFASCEQLVDPSIVADTAGRQREPAKEYGRVNIVIGNPAPSVMRTILPTWEENDYKDFTNIVLYNGFFLAGSIYVGEVELASWDTYDEMKNGCFIEIGTYHSFLLTAERDGTVFAQTLYNVEVKAHTPITLVFDSMRSVYEYDEDGNISGYGAIEAKIRLSSSVVERATSVFVAVQLDDGEVSEKTRATVNSDGQFEYTFSAKKVKIGERLVTFYIYKDTNADTPLLILPYYAYVRPGYTSKMDESVGLENTSKDPSTVLTKRTITYHNELFDETETKTVEYIAGVSSILEPSALGFSSHGIFLYWADTPTPMMDDKYYAGDIANFEEENINLYASWGDNAPTAYIFFANPPEDGNWKNLQYVQRDSSTVPSLSDAGFTFDTGEYQFLGWNTAADGSGTRIKDYLVGNHTLYAQWCKKSAKGYMVSSARELNAILGALNQDSSFGREPCTIILQNDIDCTGTPLPSSNSFGMYDSVLNYGDVFDGGEYTIKGLTGKLFVRNSGTIKDVTIMNSVISMGMPNSEANGIIGSNAGVISGCTFLNVTIITPSNDWRKNAGIIGSNEATITNCKVIDCSISGRNSGGIVVTNYYGKISNSIVKNTTITADDFAGGIVGSSYGSGAITDCEVSGCTITGAEAYEVAPPIMDVYVENITTSGNTVQIK